MSYNSGHYHGYGEEGYPGPHPYGPPPYYHAPPPNYAAPPAGYPPGPFPPPNYHGYSPRYPQAQNGPYYPPPMPYQSSGGSWPNQGPRNFNGHNNRGRQNFRQPFNGHQQNWNDGSGRKRRHDNYNSQVGHQDKKQKVNKKDLPENNKFSCDTCNRGFKTEDQYQVHIDSHVKCRFEGCEFVAHEKLVHLHIEHVHLSGYASKLESAKNIEEWKEERKKNYPTKENIERKEKERQEAIERGEFVGRRGRGRGKFANNWTDRRKQRFQGRGSFPHPQDQQQDKQQDQLQDQPQISQDCINTEAEASTPEVAGTSESVLTEESVETGQVQTIPQVVQPETPVSETKIESEDAPEELPSHIEKLEVIPEQDGVKAKPTKVEPPSDKGGAERNQSKQRNQKQRICNRKEPLAKKLVERDVRSEMGLMLQIATFFTEKLKEREESERQL